MMPYAVPIAPAIDADTMAAICAPFPPGSPAITSFHRGQPRTGTEDGRLELCGDRLRLRVPPLPQAYKGRVQAIPELAEGQPARSQMLREGVPDDRVLEFNLVPQTIGRVYGLVQHLTRGKNAEIVQAAKAALEVQLMGTVCCSSGAGGDALAAPSPGVVSLYDVRDSSPVYGVTALERYLPAVRFMLEAVEAVNAIDAVEALEAVEAVEAMDELEAVEAVKAVEK